METGSRSSGVLSVTATVVFPAVAAAVGLPAVTEAADLPAVAAVLRHPPCWRSLGQPVGRGCVTRGVTAAATAAASAAVTLQARALSRDSAVPC